MDGGDLEVGYDGIKRDGPLHNGKNRRVGQSARDFSLTDVFASILVFNAYILLPTNLAGLSLLPYGVHHG